MDAARKQIGQRDGTGQATERPALSVVSAATPAPRPSPPPAPPGAPPPATRVSRRTVTGVALSLLLVLAVASALWWFRDSLPRPGSRTVADTQAPAAPRTAVAVMPLATDGGEGSLTTFGDTLSLELIESLGHVPGLTVSSRSAVFIYRQLKADRKRIAADLHVGTLVEGSARLQGELVHVTVVLTDAATGQQFWTGNFERPFKELLQLQEDVARGIVAAVAPGGAEGATSIVLPPPPTRDMEAYRLYLQAVQPMEANAVALLDKAIGRDPKFARAWAARANVRAWLAGAGLLPGAEIEAVERDAREALSLQPGFADALYALGSAQALRGDWSGAEKSFNDAIAADPREIMARGNLVTQVLQSVGHLSRSSALLEQNHQLVPGDSATVMLLATQFSIMGNDAQALKFADLAVELGWPPTATPLPQVRANAAVRSGHFDQGAAQIASGLLPGVRDSAGAAVTREVYAALADPLRRPVALAALEEFVRRIGIGRIDASFRKDLIADFVMLGDIDQAFAFANRVVDEYRSQGSAGVAWGMLWIPEMRPFRQDPRFQELARRLGFFDYWRAHGAPDGCEFAAETLRCH